MSKLSQLVLIGVIVCVSGWPMAAQALIPPASCGDPSDVPGETESDESVAYWTAQEPDMVMCSHGYWAEKCGAHRTANAIFDRCIEGGYVGAMIWKALMYENGNGVPKDDVKATELMHRAAMSDDKAYATLGKLHYATALYLGRGIERNVDEAMKWFQQAADEGDSDAIEFLKTGTHTADRDVRGRSVAMQLEALEQKGQHLSAVIDDDKPTTNISVNGLLLLLLGLLLAGAFRQAMKRKVLPDGGA